MKSNLPSNGSEHRGEFHVVVGNEFGESSEDTNGYFETSSSTATLNNEKFYKASTPEQFMATEKTKPTTTSASSRLRSSRMKLQQLQQQHQEVSKRKRLVFCVTLYLKFIFIFSHFLISLFTMSSLLFSFLSFFRVDSNSSMSSKSASPIHRIWPIRVHKVTTMEIVVVDDARILHIPLVCWLREGKKARWMPKNATWDDSSRMRENEWECTVSTTHSR